jgi:hypothetical protein
MRSRNPAEEDPRIEDWIREHPSTPAELTVFGLSYQAAKKWLKDHDVPSLGKLRFKSKGQPPELFGYSGKSDNLEHEAILSKILLPYFVHGLKIIRPGEHGADGEIHADERFFVECDRGTESHSRVSDRLANFLGTPHFVLFITTTQRRIDNLRDDLWMFADFLLFSTIERVRKDPLNGEVFEDVYGDKISVLKQPSL